MLRLMSISLGIMLLAISVTGEDNYYYSDGRKISLTPVNDRLVIGFVEDGVGDFSELFADYPELADTISPDQIGNRFFIFDARSGTDLGGLFDLLKQDSSILLAQNVFINELGGLEAFTNSIVVKCSGFLNDSEYDSLLAFYGLEETGFSRAMPWVRYLRITEEANLTVLETANRLYEQKGILFSHPIFAAREYRSFYTPPDPFFEYQWNFYNTEVYDNEEEEEIPGQDIDAHLAWEITKGDPSIIVAVLDGGISNHADFPSGALIDTIDMVGRFRHDPEIDTNCAPGFCDSCAHGYAVSGLIIAEHNSIGLAGLVPECKLIFVKIVDDQGYYPQTDSIMAEALIYAAQNGAKVISNSWGAYFYGPTDWMTEALNYVTDPSIAGYSCAVFFAAGNNSYWGVAYPANMPQTLAVGATDSIDCRWDYSAYGVELDVMAPSGNIKTESEVWPGRFLLGSIMTIDRPGDSGYTPHYYQDPYLPFCRFCPHDFVYPLEEMGNDYFCSFGGTSAACPQVAGIAAMIMSRRPDLADSNYTIYNIIKHSAEDQVGPDSGYYPDLLGWDQFYGWGRVNACRALLAVCRGDANNDGTINQLDITYIIDYLYKGGPPPEPDPLMGDADCNGIVVLLDVTYLISYLYKGGPEPLICFDYGD